MKQTKLSAAQAYLLAWMDASYRNAAAHGIDGVGIASTLHVPPCVPLADKTYVYEPSGVGMRAMRGLERRGFATEPKPGIFVITDAGCHALSARAELLNRKAP